MSGAINVVLADDTEDVRVLLRTCLTRDARFRVVGEAENGLQAVETVAALRPDAVVLDLAMPVMDGLEAIPLIRQRAPDCAIVVFSGFDSQRMAQRAQQAGAHRYIEKGTALDDIARVLAEACGRGHDGPVMSARAQDPITQLREADDFKSALLAALSHDLRTPLTIIKGYAATLGTNRQHLSDADVGDILGRIGTNADRLERMLSDLLAFERLQRGTVHASLTTIDLAPLVRRVVDAIDAPERARVVVTSAPAEVVADEGLLERSIDNLVSNALRHTPPESKVWIRISRQGERATIAVEDAGPGVPPAEREAIFEPFARGATSAPGTGIGLSLVKRFVDLMGGTISVDERAGGGASFVIDLPVRASAQRSA